MKRIPNGKYTKEFREETVKLVTIQGHSIDEAVSSLCQYFNVSPSGYYHWQKA